MQLLSFYVLMKPINTYLLKKWIGNERRKRTLAERMQDENLSESVDVKGPPMKHMSSGYNIFTSKMLSSGTVQDTIIIIIFLLDAQ